MSGRATLIHAVFRKAEEIDDEKGEKGEFAVNSFYLGRKMEESDARRARASVHHFLPLPVRCGRGASPPPKP